MIKTLYFDFGNVIGHFNHWRSIRRLAEHTDMPAAELYAAILDNDLENAFEHGTLTAVQYAEEAIRRGRLTCSPTLFIAMFEDIFTPNAEVLYLIPKLSPRYRILLASNTNAIHFDHYTRQFAETFRHFAALPTSHQAGHRKPQPGFFEYCQRFAEASPAECAFIDDIAENVAAGEKHGWHGIHYRPDDSLAEKLKAAGVACTVIRNKKTEIERRKHSARPSALQHGMRFRFRWRSLGYQNSKREGGRQRLSSMQIGHWEAEHNAIGLAGLDALNRPLDSGDCDVQTRPGRPDACQ